MCDAISLCEVWSLRATHSARCGVISHALALEGSYLGSTISNSSLVLNAGNLNFLAGYGPRGAAETPLFRDDYSPFDETN